MLLKDLGIFLKNIALLPKVVLASKVSLPLFRRKYSEENFVLNQGISAFKVLKTAIIGSKTYAKDQFELLEVGDFSCSREKWFFVNGICTSKDMASFNALCLSNLFEKNITVVYNPTQGIAVDLLECVIERTFNRTCKTSLNFYHEILQAFKTYDSIKIIAHSQGGIITSRVLRLLEQYQSPEIYKNLEVYTFGSGTNEDVSLPDVYQEHFANSEDFVAQVGVVQANVKSNLFIYKSRGHLLNRDYLEHFAMGYFCKKASKLYELIKVQQNLNN